MNQPYMDYHFHSNCSPDSREPLENHIQAAKERGLSQICLTDHWDLVEEVEGCAPTLSPPLQDWYNIFSTAVEKAQTPEVKVCFGVEVGDGYEKPQEVAEILKDYPFDFIIGSVHSLYNSGGVGIYATMQHCNTQEKVSDFFRDYFHTLLIHSKLDYFDTLAHINYPFRYLNKKFHFALTDYMEEITAVAEELIKGDRCLELNTSRGVTVEEWRPVLQRYKDLGGKNITIGSDAHMQQHISLGIPEAVALLQDCGFSHYTVFEKRIPKEIPIQL